MTNDYSRLADGWAGIAACERLFMPRDAVSNGREGDMAGVCGGMGLAHSTWLQFGLQHSCVFAARLAAARDIAQLWATITFCELGSFCLA